MSDQCCTTFHFFCCIYKFKVAVYIHSSGFFESGAHSGTSRDVRPRSAAHSSPSASSAQISAHASAVDSFWLTPSGMLSHRCRAAWWTFSFFACARTPQRIDNLLLSLRTRCVCALLRVLESQRSWNLPYHLLVAMPLELCPSCKSCASWCPELHSKTRLSMWGASLLRHSPSGSFRLTQTHAGAGSGGANHRRGQMAS